jgi:hypothetical protein
MGTVKLSDLEVKTIRERRAAGVSVAVLAERYDVSPQHVRRISKGEQRAMIEETALSLPGRAVEALEEHLGELELDGSGQVKAAMARALAEKIDACSASESSQAAVSLPALVARLDALMFELKRDDRQPDMLDRLLATRKARLALSINGGDS